MGYLGSFVSIYNAGDLFVMFHILIICIGMGGGLPRVPQELFPPNMISEQEVGGSNPTCVKTNLINSCVGVLGGGSQSSQMLQPHMQREH